MNDYFYIPRYPPLPKGPFAIVLADCPWQYDNGGVPQAGVNAQYSTLSIDDLKKLPINEITYANSILFAWATFPKLPEALEVIKAWGFKYKTLGFSWIKTNKDGSPFFGVGYYAKSNCEVCLMATKGKGGSKTSYLPVISNKVSSCVITQKRRHSSKPPEVRNRIVELFGDVPRIELFARSTCEGWASWGLEVENC